VLIVKEVSEGRAPGNVISPTDCRKRERYCYETPGGEDENPTSNMLLMLCVHFGTWAPPMKVQDRHIWLKTIGLGPAKVTNRTQDNEASGCKQLLASTTHKQMNLEGRAREVIFEMSRIVLSY